MLYNKSTANKCNGVRHLVATKWHDFATNESISNKTGLSVIRDIEEDSNWWRYSSPQQTHSLTTDRQTRHASDHVMRLR